MDTGSRLAAGDARLTFYANALRILQRARVPFLVGGAFAQSRHTGRDRETKDLDIWTEDIAPRGPA